MGLALIFPQEDPEVKSSHPSHANQTRVMVMRPLAPPRSITLCNQITSAEDGGINTHEIKAQELYCQWTQIWETTRDGKK